VSTGGDPFADPSRVDSFDPQYLLDTLMFVPRVSEGQKTMVQPGFDACALV
jgi:hypothetical protein